MVAGPIVRVVSFHPPERKPGNGAHLKVFRRLFARWQRVSSSPEQEAAAKRWLDNLRRNELSVNAQRRISPDEPIQSPRIGHGSSHAVATPLMVSPDWRSQQKPKHSPTRSAADYATGDASTADSDDCDASSGDSGSCSGSD